MKLDLAIIGRLENNTGQATVYLGCARRMDRKSIRPDNRPTKRISEARPPIERYPCKGKIAITIDINIRQAKVKIKHLISHERPTYRENNLPENAITWIFNNLNRNLRKVDVYKRLCEEGFVDSTNNTHLSSSVLLGFKIFRSTICHQRLQSTHIVSKLLKAKRIN